MSASLANKYGYQSKTLRFSILHEVAYHFVHGHSMDVRPTFYEKLVIIFKNITFFRFPLGQAAVRWKFNPDPHVYIDVEDALRYIPPLPPFAGLERFVFWTTGYFSSRGWFMLYDFICALPLSVMVLCAYIPKCIDVS